jgi:hypothetical protein
MAVVDYAEEFDGDVVTTQWVLTEVADALAGPRSRHDVRPAFDEFETDEGTRMIEVSPMHYAEGSARYDSRADKEWSLTDCISFVVMEQEGLREALTGDRHFAQAGFVPLFAD